MISSTSRTNDAVVGLDDFVVVCLRKLRCNSTYDGASEQATIVASVMHARSGSRDGDRKDKVQRNPQFLLVEGQPRHIRACKGS